MPLMVKIRRRISQNEIQAIEGEVSVDKSKCLDGPFFQNQDKNLLILNDEFPQVEGKELEGNSNSLEKNISLQINQKEVERRGRN